MGLSKLESVFSNLSIDSTAGQKNNSSNISLDKPSGLKNEDSRILNQPFAIAETQLKSDINVPLSVAGKNNISSDISPSTFFKGNQTDLSSPTSNVQFFKGTDTNMTSNISPSPSIAGKNNMSSTISPIQMGSGLAKGK